PTYLAAYQQLLVLADSAFKHPDHALENYSVPGFYVDANGHRTNSRALQSDAFDAYACALAYQLSGNKKYAQEAIRFLNAWAHKNTQYSDADGSLVMSYSGTAMVIAADLVRSSKVWHANDIAAFDQWVANVYITACDVIRNRKNSWADCVILGAILTSLHLGGVGELQEKTSLSISDRSSIIVDE